VGINCLRAFPGRGIRVWGARTLSSDPAWRYVNVRRLMLMIEEAVDEATQWAVFEPHDSTLRQTLVHGVAGFLDTVWRQGALVGVTAEEAFYVKCDETTNPPDRVDRGQLVVEVGVAPTRPAEFVVFRVGRTVEELELVER
jgi:phage tail sheath protein FI